MATPFPFQSGATLLASQLNAITELVINDKTDSYTLVAGDAGEYVIMNKATATTITVPNSVFAAGQIVRIVNKGSGVCTITAGAGTTVSSTGTLVLAQYAVGTLIALSASAFIYEAGDTSPVTMTSATVGTSQGTTSTSFTDLATSGPSVTVTTGTSALVFLSTFLTAPAAGYALMGFAVSGATTTSASDGNSLFIQAPAAGSQQMSLTKVVVVTLTAGSNTFTAKYRTTTGTSTFENRFIQVVTF